VVFGAIILVHLDVPIVLGEGQVGAIDHDDFEYIRVPAAGRYPVGGKFWTLSRPLMQSEKIVINPFSPGCTLLVVGGKEQQMDRHQTR
jgi:hypothetical protein